VIKKGKAASITQQLSNLAQKEEISYQHLATSFLIERLVARLTADKALGEKLVFKGGYVALRVYESTRYTIDLDALLLKSNLKETLEQTKNAAEKGIGDAVWFRLEREVEHITEEADGGVRQVYRAGIGEPPKNIKRAQVINFDIGIGDPVIPGPVPTDTPEMIGNDELSWLVYPVETIIAEKLHASISRGSDNSRSKDIFDLTHFLPKADPKTLKKALKECFSYRKTDLPENLSKHLSKLDISLLRRGWPSAVGSIKDAPTCDEAFQKILTQLKQILNE